MPHSLTARPPKRLKVATATAVPPPPRPPPRSKIYFCTRTHGQVQKVVSELRHSAYAPRTTVLASRRHYCIHPSVSLSLDVDHACTALLASSSGCSFQRGVDRLVSSPAMHAGATHAISDIEDLVRLGHQHHACPYFAARGLARKAELVLAPYQYVLDPIVRRVSRVKLQDAVVIFDEAHNMESAASDAASCELSHSQLTTALAELDRLADATTPALSLTRRLLQTLRQWLVRMVDTDSLTHHSARSHSRVWGAETLLGLLAQAGVSVDNVVATRHAWTAALKTLADTADAQTVSLGSTRLIERMYFVFAELFADKLSRLPDYRLVVRRTLSEQPRARSAAQRWVVVLCVWCFNPAVGFQSLRDHCRSVLLSSGTLSPLLSFPTELNCKFPHCLEANHVVDVKSQLLAGVLQVGSHQQSLRATFRTCDSLAFQDALGATLLAYCGAIPHGVLLFFPSYFLVTKCLARWNRTGISQQLRRLKEVVIEPRGVGEDFEDALACFRRHASGRGALFLAVCRGKVSEGLDFGDRLARAVLLVGVPFPNLRDLKVKLKMSYNDQRRARAGASTKDALLSGRDWYHLQAMRSVNQAIGRCIRHQDDYGAILLLDPRFRELQFRARLSKWIRAAITVHTNVSQSVALLRDFFWE